MPKELTLDQKVLIVKWYYKNDEVLFKVEALFEALFHFTPTSATFDRVVKRFESTGSVIEDVLYEIKVEAVSEDIEVDVDNMSLEIYDDINQDIFIKEESFEEGEPTATNITAATTTESIVSRSPTKAARISPKRKASEKRKTLSKNRSCECTVCGKIIQRQHNLRKHMLLHTGERPHRCHICDKSFMRQDHWKTHLLIHSGERTHQCPQCDTTFIRAEHLKAHLKVHSGERPHKCHICEKSFNRLGNLTVHITTHTGERTQECFICEKTFVLPHQLKNHLKTHAGKNHICHICGRASTGLGNLKSHMRTHNKDRSHVKRKRSPSPSQAISEL